MAELNLHQKNERNRRNRRKKVWKRIVSVLACLVVFCTTYALILPAITMERLGELTCTQEEHLHTKKCYSEETLTILDCPCSAHVHDESCYDPQGQLLCGRSDYLIHTHGEGCYDKDGILQCTIPERGPAEGECLHTHDESCYDETGRCICTTPELLEHIHSEECFIQRQSLCLTCGKVEHRHDRALCYTREISAKELPEQWEKSLPETLLGNWPRDLIAVAETQLGYRESEEDFILDDAGYPKGYTRYGDWNGDPYEDWTGSFVSFCLHYAQIETEQFPFLIREEDWTQALRQEALFLEEDPSGAQPGNLVFLNTDRDDFPDRVGIITDTLLGDGGDLLGLRAIEGDCEGQVQMVEYSIQEESIMGFGDLNAAYLAQNQSRIQKRSYTDDHVNVTVSYPVISGIPAEAELSVQKMTPQKLDDYDGYLAQAQTLLEKEQPESRITTITDFYLYDICFLVDGVEVQPLTPVDVEITIHSTQLDQQDEVTVIHYGEAGAERTADQKYSFRDGNTLNTSFETSGFSLFAVVTSQTDFSSIVTLNPVTLTSSNFSGIAGNTYAITANGYALNVDSNGALAAQALYLRESGSVTGHEAVVRWTFESSGSTNTYYISTKVGETTYYLTAANGALTLTTTKTAVMNASRSDTGVLLQNSGNYINIASTGVSLGSSMVLSLYNLKSGTYTVVFDGQIGCPTYFGSSNKKFDEAEKVTVQTDSEGYVKLPTAEETAIPGNYPMRLNGWYDIINAVYYDSSMLGQTIRVTGDTIFYPEWIAATYDIGQNVNVVSNQPDTSNFIETRVFDYTELFNTHSAYYDESSETWIFDPDSELGFIFFDYLTTGNIGNISNKNVSVDGITVNEEKTRGTRGSSLTFPGTITPGIANDARLEALFGEGSFPGRINVGEADWLYSYDAETGYYYYNSAANAAAYNQSEQRFYVYEDTVNIDSQNSLHDFLPFNYGQETFAEKDNEANYWFGMKSEIQFYLPNDSGSGENKAANGVTDMQLRFSGDDDVWIFIDGELALDLGGVHDVVYGEINFSTGKVKTGQALSSSNIAANEADTFSNMPGLSGTAGITTTDLPVLEGGREHTITIYYLERGSSLSNCAIYFNLSPAYELHLTKTDADTGERLEGAEFMIFDDRECTIPAEHWITNENGELESVTDEVFVTNENGTAYLWGLLAGRDYYIKEVTPPPVGYPSMDDYVIRINLSEPAESVVIATDSNGKEWIFATEYIFDEEGAHRVFIEVRNSKFTGGEKELYVEKQWAEGSTQIPDEITVCLYADGVDTGRTITLSAANDWKGIFYELPIYASDENGLTDREIVYTVKEIVPSGYYVTYGETTGKGTTEAEVVVPGYWSTADALVDGGVYRFVYNNLAVQGSNSTSLTVGTNDQSNEAQQWTAIASGSRFLLQNKAYPSRYMSISSTGATCTTTSSGNNVNIQYSNSRLSSASSRYLGAGSSNGSSCSSQRYSFRATSFDLEKWNPPSTEIGTTEYDIPGFLITNTPLPNEFSIPVEKLWDDSLGVVERKELTIELYQVTEGETPTVSLLQTLILNEANGWQGSFTQLSYPEEGTYYCISEVTEGYYVTYSGETLSVFYNEQKRTVCPVVIGDDGTAATIRITNKAQILLPDTGGEGMILYASGGLLLIAAASGLLLYRARKRRKEDPLSS